ncbi:MAG: LPS export ABC transporter permease LptG [Gammaproteobacteria bacterium]
MKRLPVYIARALLLSIFIIWLGLFAFDAVFAFLGELSDIGRGSYGTSQAMIYTLLTLPRRAYELFPMACLVGAMLGLGHLAANSELIAMRAAGLSLTRLMLWSAVTGLIMTAFVTWLGEGVAPVAETLAGNLRTEAIFNRVALQNERGVWVRDGKRYVHIGSTSDARDLRDVQVLEFDENHRLLYASQIDRAEYDGSKWLLTDVTQSQFEEEKIEVISIPKASWSLLVEPELLDVLAREPDNMNLGELYRYIKYLEASEISSQRYRAHLWKRIAKPFSAMAMLVLGAVFILQIQQRKSGGWRLFVGIVAGLLFKLFNEVFSQAGLVYGFPVMVSAFAPVVVVALLAVWLVRRTETKTIRIILNN